MSDECDSNARSGGRPLIPAPQNRRHPVGGEGSDAKFAQNPFRSFRGPRCRCWPRAGADEKLVQAVQAQSPVAPRAVPLAADDHRREKARRATGSLREGWTCRWRDTKYAVLAGRLPLRRLPAHSYSLRTQAGWPVAGDGNPMADFRATCHVCAAVLASSRNPGCGKMAARGG
jgi:hypothetical protein